MQRLFLSAKRTWDSTSQPNRTRTKRHLSRSNLLQVRHCHIIYPGQTLFQVRHTHIIYPGQTSFRWGSIGSSIQVKPPSGEALSYHLSRSNPLSGEAHSYHLSRSNLLQVRHYHIIYTGQTSFRWGSIGSSIQVKPPSGEALSYHLSRSNPLSGEAHSYHLSRSNLLQVRHYHIIYTGQTSFRRGTIISSTQIKPPLGEALSYHLPRSNLLQVRLYQIIYPGQTSSGDALSYHLPRSNLYHLPRSNLLRWGPIRSSFQVKPPQVRPYHIIYPGQTLLQVRHNHIIYPGQTSFRWGSIISSLQVKPPSGERVPTYLETNLSIHRIVLAKYCLQSLRRNSLSDLPDVKATNVNSPNGKAMM